MLDRLFKALFKVILFMILLVGLLSLFIGAHFNYIGGWQWPPYMILFKYKERR